MANRAKSLAAASLYGLPMDDASSGAESPYMGLRPATNIVSLEV